MQQKPTMLFVALQRDVNPKVLSRELEVYRIRQWLYLGEDSAWRVQAESVISSRARRISIARLLDEVSWRLRRPYIDWIGELSRLNHSVDWWASELAAKNPYYNLYIRICLLAVAKQLIIAGFDRPTLIVCSSRASLTEVIRFASGTEFALQQLPSVTMLPILRTIGQASRRYLGGGIPALGPVRRPIVGERYASCGTSPC